MRHRLLTVGFIAGIGLCLVTALHERRSKAEIEAKVVPRPVSHTQSTLSHTILPPRAVVPPHAVPPRAALADDEKPAHLIYVEPQADERVPQANHEGLDRALEDEEEDRAWTAKVWRDVIDVLSVDAQMHVDEVRCAQTFCRVRMTKPIESELDWPEVDSLLAPIARGETIFAAAPSGTMTTGAVYFSADDAVLPLDQARLEGEEE